jgi:transposase
MKPISRDKREIIITAKERGEKPITIALWTGVALSSVYNILRLHRETNNCEPKPYTGRQGRLTGEQLQRIQETVENKKDITLDELISELNLPIKKSRLSVILIAMGYSFKKRRYIQPVNNVKMSKKSARNGMRGKKT